METKKVLIIGGGYPVERLSRILGANSEKIVIGGQLPGKRSAVRAPRDIVRFNLAFRKRERRIMRNLRNEALQGNEPEGLELRGNEWFATCLSCQGDYAIYCMPQEFDPDMSYCGGSEWCCP